MKFEEKLRKEMLLKGFNQQRLARASGVSDSEVSRILAGKSQPGLENALKLARAVGVSLDYLADDRLDADPTQATSASPWEQGLLEVAAEIGPRNAAQLLMTAQALGFDLALRRLCGLETSKPVIEVDTSRPPRGSMTGAGTGAGPGRASSA